MSGHRATCTDEVRMVKEGGPHLARLWVGTPAQAPGALVQPRERLAKAVHRPAQVPVR